jgi:hypothetical protein
MRLGERAEFASTRLERDTVIIRRREPPTRDNAMIDTIQMLWGQTVEFFSLFHIVTQIGLGLAVVFYVTYLLKKKPDFAVLSATCMLYALVPMLGYVRGLI